MLIKLVNEHVIQVKTGLAIRCPACRQIGTFEAIYSEAVRFAVNPTRFTSSRRCPNHTCRAHLFVIWEEPAKVLVTYPAERVDFDSTGIPPKVIAALEEAISCHANGAYVASAIMVRRTMEELCADKAATGATLKDRLTKLGELVILPPGLLAGLDNLRLLGNDAAHVNANTYAQVGKAEVEVGLDVVKEVLKAVYQLDSLVKRLDALKKQS